MRRESWRDPASGLSWSPWGPTSPAWRRPSSPSPPSWRGWWGGVWRRPQTWLACRGSSPVSATTPCWVCWMMRQSPTLQTRTDMHFFHARAFLCKSWTSGVLNSLMRGRGGMEVAVRIFTTERLKRSPAWVPASRRGTPGWTWRWTRRFSLCSTSSRPTPRWWSDTRKVYWRSTRSPGRRLEW